MPDRAAAVICFHMFKLRGNMKLCSFFRPSVKLVATIFCATLLVPAGRATERDRPVPVVQGTEPSRGPAPEPFTEKELAELSRRAEDPGQKVVGGALTNQQLTYIVIALATAVIILVIIAA